METVVVTLRLPSDLYSLVKKYAKAFIINEQFSNSKAIENTSVLNSKLLENQKPSFDDVVDEVKKRNSPVNAQRFFQYYERRNWLDKGGLPFDWKQKLAEWESYNLERSNKEQEKAVTQPKISASAVAKFLADEKKEAS